jgi:hypothetical protein
MGWFCTCLSLSYEAAVFHNEPLCLSFFAITNHDWGVVCLEFFMSYKTEIPKSNFAFYTSNIDLFRILHCAPHFHGAKFGNSGGNVFRFSIFNARYSIGIADKWSRNLAGFADSHQNYQTKRQAKPVANWPKCTMLLDRTFPYACNVTVTFKVTVTFTITIENTARAPRCTRTPPEARTLGTVFPPRPAGRAACDIIVLRLGYR